MPIPVMEWESLSSADIEGLRRVWENETNSPTHTSDGIEEMDIDPSDLLIIVPDTNIWIGHPDLLKNLLNTDFEKVSYPTIIIPWMVLQELDVLIKIPRQSGNAAGSERIRAFANKKSTNEPRKSVSFIYDLLSSRHPRVRGQKASEAVSAQEKYEVHNSDDRILAAALQCLEKKSHVLVVFLTDDRNLLNKALVECSDNRLLICNSASAMEKITLKLNLNAEKPSQRSAPEASKQYYGNGVKSSSSLRRTSPRRKSSSSSICDISSKTLPATIGIGMPSKSNLQQSKKPLKRLGNEVNVKGASTLVNTNKSDAVSKLKGIRKMQTTSAHNRPVAKSPEFSIKCDSFSEVLDLLKKLFSYIVEFKMKEDFGEKLWKHSLKYQPPWTLETAIKSVLHHHFGVFSYIFGIRSKIQVESLLSLLQSYSRKNKNCDREQEQLEEDIVELTLTLIILAKTNSGSSNLSTNQNILDCEKSLTEYIKQRKK